MRTNKKAVEVIKERTHGGAPAAKTPGDEAALLRSVMSCLLGENEFYEGGEKITVRIQKLAKNVSAEFLAKTAVKARKDFGLRHVPLMLLETLTVTGKGQTMVADTFAEVIRRPDETAEYLAMHIKAGGKKMVPAQARKGLARAFRKFDEYQLSKWNRDNQVKLRDVLRLCHPKPADAAQADLWKRVLKDELKTADTWEVALSTGADKKEAFTRLLKEKKLGYAALLKNLRNMVEAKVDHKLIKEAILARRGADGTFPLSFFSAAKHAPVAEKWLSDAMVAQIKARGTLPGKTVIVVDVSGSMTCSMSGKSTETRLTASCALAAALAAMFEDPRVFATAGSDYRQVADTKEMPAREGFALAEALVKSANQLGGGGIFLKQCLAYVDKEVGSYDRVIVITDEQDCSGDRENPRNVTPKAEKAYMVNVASYKNGIGYGKWVHIDGFSEGVVRFILEAERSQN